MSQAKGCISEYQTNSVNFDDMIHNRSDLFCSS